MTFGRWKVVVSAPSRKGLTLWLCRCECGTEREVYTSKLVSGSSKSCGCLNADLLRARRTTHGMRRSSEYNIWNQMRFRCSNPKSTVWGYYGGRGITVCERWAKFEHFYADMGPRPVGTSLDREDTNGSYSPDNCRWATRHEQRVNSRPKRWKVRPK